MQTAIVYRFLLLSILPVLSACSDDGESFVVDLGVIVASDRSDPPIDHPATSQSGIDIPITVTTYGDDCTWVERTEVEVTGLKAIVRPFDKSATESLCADTIFSYPHAATIRFQQPGIATITILGYDEGDRFGDVIERSSTLEIQ